MKTEQAPSSNKGNGSAWRDLHQTDASFSPAYIGEACNDEVAKLFAAAPDLLAALEQAKSMLETASRYFPKSIKNSDRFSLLNTLANSVNPAIAKARGK